MYIFQCVIYKIFKKVVYNIYYMITDPVKFHYIINTKMNDKNLYQVIKRNKEYKINETYFYSIYRINKLYKYIQKNNHTFELCEFEAYFYEKQKI